MTNGTHKVSQNTVPMVRLLFFSKILSRRESYVKICNETGSKTSQYKKLGKVKKEFPAARIHNLQSFYGCFCLLEVINKSIFFALTQVGKEQNEQTKNHH